MKAAISSSATQTLSRADREQVDLALAQYRDQPGPLLQVLHAVQQRLGHIPDASIPVVAESLNLSRAEVHGVVTFYHHFRRRPPGQHVVQLCQAEACRAMHCESLTAHVKRRLGIDFHETTADGRFMLEPVYCLGNCACSPAVMIDGELHGRVTPERFDALLAQREAGK
ncbi:MAG TPA: formate dehydrogenase subunit gamma [Povalibacter sp.]|nr:formate dehydrogenase subunit gamma [Povalibacter sp.]